MNKVLLQIKAYLNKVVKPVMGIQISYIARYLFLTINFISKSSSGWLRSHFVLYLRHVALLQDVDCLLDVVDDPLDDDVRVVDLDRVHDRLVDVHGQLEKELILFC